MLLKTAWDWFSKYIRKRDSLKRGDGEYVKCVTCGAVKIWEEMQAGHFEHGKSLSYMDERNVHAQCVRCNKWMSGNLNAYNAFMLAEYGQEVIDEIKVLSKQKGIKYSQDELKAMSKKWRDKFRELQ